jgi:hypothetical protein
MSTEEERLRAKNNSLVELQRLLYDLKKDRPAWSDRIKVIQERIRFYVNACATFGAHLLDKQK